MGLYTNTSAAITYHLLDSPGSNVECNDITESNLGSEICTKLDTPSWNILVYSDDNTGQFVGASLTLETTQIDSNNQFYLKLVGSSDPAENERIPMTVEFEPCYIV